MLCFNQISRPILKWIFCAFYTVLLILVLSKHSSVFTRLSEFIMKLFPRGLVHVNQVFKPPESFRLSLCEKQYAETKPWIRHC